MNPKSKYNLPQKIYDLPPKKELDTLFPFGKQVLVVDSPFVVSVVRAVKGWLLFQHGYNGVHYIKDPDYLEFFTFRALFEQTKMAVDEEGNPTNSRWINMKFVPVDSQGKHIDKEKIKKQIDKAFGSWETEISSKSKCEPSLELPSVGKEDERPKKKKGWKLWRFWKK
jgi:hypothetical protein